MCRVAGQDDAASDVTLGQARIAAISRSPGDVANDDVVATGAFVDQGLQDRDGWVELGVRRDRRLKLEQVGAGERAKRQRQGRARSPTMPGVAIEAVEVEIGDDGLESQAFAGKADLQCLANKTAAAIGADQITRLDGLRAPIRAKSCLDLAGGWLNPDDFGTESRRVAQFRQSVALDPFGQELRQHGDLPVRFGGAGRTALVEQGVGECAVSGIGARRRIGATCGKNTVGQAHLFEHFQRARLQSLAARSDERRWRLVDQTKGNVPAGQFDGQGKPGRPGAADQNVRVHVSLYICV